MTRRPTTKEASAMLEHTVGTREEWLAARVELLEREKELTRRSDELARQRRELPWVPIHTYSTYARGLEVMLGCYPLLDRLPKGRDEGGSTEFWVRRHDEYEGGRGLQA
jgi:predicted dithiol-disulfide oxidoreductase (DUF899 family)